MEDKPELIQITNYDDLLKALQEKASEGGISKYRISKETEIPLPTVSRIINGETVARLDNILSIFKTMGVEVFIKK